MQFTRRSLKHLSIPPCIGTKGYKSLLGTKFINIHKRWRSHCGKEPQVHRSVCGDRWRHALLD